MTKVNYKFLEHSEVNSACKASETSVKYMFLEFDEEN